MEEGDVPSVSQVEATMKNGQSVAAFERAFAEYVGAKYAIALCNGTATLHTALVALGVKPGDRVATTPLTMSATTLAILHAGATPVYCDVDPDTWLMSVPRNIGDNGWTRFLPVSLYGLHQPYAGPITIDDAAQTLRKHSGAAFTSYSFQASKILPLGEGGMLVTDSEELATKAREFSSLGYRMRADQPRIDPAEIKSPTFARHHSVGFNYRMNDLTAERGLHMMREWRRALPSWATGGVEVPDCRLHADGSGVVDQYVKMRRLAAFEYRKVIEGCSWLTPQHVPEGWTHDYWTYAVACDTPERALWLLDAVERHGGERPYPAWRLSYHEPALKHLTGLDGLTWEGEKETARAYGICPVAESIQPRLVQFQTNNIQSAEQNARALRKAIEEVG